MNIQEYYLIKLAAEKNKKDEEGSAILNHLLTGDPAEKSFDLGNPNKKDSAIWKVLDWLPGVGPGRKLWKSHKDTKNSNDILEKELGNDNYGKVVLDRLKHLRGEYSKGNNKVKLVQYGIPAAAGALGATYGVAKSMYKNKKEQKEYDDLINSEDFKQLPPELQHAILTHGYGKQNRGFFKRMLRNAKYGVGYGLGAQAMATPAAWAMSFRPYRKHLATIASPDYKYLSDDLQSLLSLYAASKYPDPNPVTVNTFNDI